MKKGTLGFSLIEVMIAVAIVAVLAAIAYPQWTNQIKRGKRSAAQAAMMDISNKQQQYFLGNRGYAATTTALNYTLPSDVSANYSVGIATGKGLNASCGLVDLTIPSFVITMTASGAQASDGNLQLSNEGVKCPSGKW